MSAGDPFKIIVKETDPAGGLTFLSHQNYRILPAVPQHPLQTMAK